MWRLKPKTIEKKSYLGKVGKNLKAEAVGVCNAVGDVWSGINAKGIDSPLFLDISASQITTFRIY